MIGNVKIEKKMTTTETPTYVVSQIIGNVKIEKKN